MFTYRLDFIFIPLHHKNAIAQIKWDSNYHHYIIKQPHHHKRTTIIKKWTNKIRFMKIGVRGYSLFNSKSKQLNRKVVHFSFTYAMRLNGKWMNQKWPDLRSHYMNYIYELNIKDIDTNILTHTHKLEWTMNVET